MGETPRVFVVDDDPLVLDIIRGILAPDYAVELFGTAEACLSRLDAVKPGMLLLDVRMPGLDGYAVMRRLQADPETQDIPVIFITSLADSASEIKALEAGAVDYITKPFSSLVVRTRVATHFALRQARRALEIRNEKLVHERAVVEGVINRMRQHRLFDDKYLRYLVTPVEQTNGDILLSAFTHDGEQWLLIGDFTGHGLSAAVAAPLVAQVFYSAVTALNDIEAALTAINDILYRQLPTEIFMAGCVAAISPARDSIRLWSAGMPECILLGADGEIHRIIPQTDILPFGIEPTIDVAKGCVRLSATPGERLYVFSDGITETANPSAELFGLARVKHFLTTRHPTAPLDELLFQLERFHGSRAFDDDITFVEILL